MKFLIFNVAVILALSALVFDQTKGSRQVPEKIAGVVETVKQKLEVVKTKKKDHKPSTTTKGQVVKSIQKNREVGLKDNEQKQEPIKTTQKRTTKKKLQKVKTQNRPVNQKIGKLGSQPKKTPSILRQKFKTGSGKTAIKNNSEIKNLLANKPRNKSDTEKKNKEGFMPDKIRKRDLMALSDEMEFFHARSLTD